MSSPAIANGRVYLASDNGYVYCLENLPPILTLSSAVIDEPEGHVHGTSDLRQGAVSRSPGTSGTATASTGLIVNHTYAKAGNYTCDRLGVGRPGRERQPIMWSRVNVAAAAEPTTPCSTSWSPWSRSSSWPRSSSSSSRGKKK